VKQPFHNEASQPERRATLRNDRRVAEGMTYHQIAVGETDLAHGRFAEVNRTAVTGATQHANEG
jgi:hypothetical protein